MKRKKIPSPSETSTIVMQDSGGFVTDEFGKETKVCDWIEHLGNGLRANNSGAADVVAFRDRSGALGEVMIPHKELINDPRKLFVALADCNYAVPSSKEHRQLIAAYLAAARNGPKQVFLLAETMGHHGDAFVIGDSIISPDGTSAVRLSGPLSEVAPRFGARGTLEQFQKKVLSRAAYSSRLMLMVGLGLAAPVLDIAPGAVNGGFALVGEAGFGKTSGLKVCAALMAGGQMPYVLSMHMTDNAPETIGFAYSDLPILLDELDAFDDDNVRGAGRLKALIQRLTSGRGKAASYLSPRARINVEFRALFACSAERSIEKYMRDGGSKTSGGQRARVACIPIDAGHGQKLFDRKLPRHRKTKKRLSADAMLKRLNEACAKYYGVAGRLYLQRLVTDLKMRPAELKAALKKDMNLFMTTVATDVSVDDRLRHRFALVYAALQLGLRYEILPSECDWALEAVSRCYYAALHSSGVISESGARETLREFLRANARAFPKLTPEMSGATFEKAMGFTRKLDGGRRQTLVKPNILRNQIFPGTAEAAVRRLTKAGVISVSATGATTQCRIPGLDRKEYFFVVRSKKIQ
jgi:hypothetical protein